LRDASDSESEEEEEKVTLVKSAKDKRLEGLENTIKLIENAQKINDWAVISTGECHPRDQGCRVG
jgi:translation initiation factor 3 subunit C